jgi:fluoride exporter
VVPLSAATWVGIAALGGVGAIGRFLLDGAISSESPGTFPAGTLAVNLLGALALGVLVGAATDVGALRLVGTGLLGAFTTFSTWIFETHRLGEDGELGLGLFNVVASLVLGMALAWAGLQLGEAI